MTFDSFTLIVGVARTCWPLLGGYLPHSQVFCSLRESFSVCLVQFALKDLGYHSECGSKTSNSMNISEKLFVTSSTFVWYMSVCLGRYERGTILIQILFKLSVPNTFSQIFVLGPCMTLTVQYILATLNSG